MKVKVKPFVKREFVIFVASDVPIVADIRLAIFGNAMMLLIDF
jgi:hypothetical protein